jgi:hypothetical protein
VWKNDNWNPMLYIKISKLSHVENETLCLYSCKCGTDVTLLLGRYVSQTENQSKK